MATKKSKEEIVIPEDGPYRRRVELKIRQYEAQIKEDGQNLKSLRAEGVRAEYELAWYVELIQAKQSFANFLRKLL